MKRTNREMRIVDPDGGHTAVGTGVVNNLPEEPTYKICIYSAGKEPV